eukprot:8313912-Karenia_brevis.AAC.1
MYNGAPEYIISSVSLETTMYQNIAPDACKSFACPLRKSCNLNNPASDTSKYVNNCLNTSSAFCALIP